MKKAFRILMILLMSISIGMTAQVKSKLTPHSKTKHKTVAKPKFHRCQWNFGGELIQCKTIIPISMEFCKMHYREGIELKTPARLVSDLFVYAYMPIRAEGSGLIKENHYIKRVAVYLY